MRLNSSTYGRDRRLLPSLRQRQSLNSSARSVRFLYAESCWTQPTLQKTIGFRKRALELGVRLLRPGVTCVGLGEPLLAVFGKMLYIPLLPPGGPPRGTARQRFFATHNAVDDVSVL